MGNDIVHVGEDPRHDDEDGEAYTTSSGGEREDPTLHSNTQIHSPSPSGSDHVLHLPAEGDAHTMHDVEEEEKEGDHRVPPHHQVSIHPSIHSAHSFIHRSPPFLASSACCSRPLFDHNMRMKSGT